MDNKDYTQMDFDKISDVITEWNSLIGTFEGGILKAKENKGFIAAIDADLDRQFTANYDENIANLIKALRDSVSQLQSVLISMGELDDDVSKKRPKRTPKDEEGGGNGGGNPGDGSTPPPDANQLVDNSKEQLEGYKNITMNGLDSVVSDLAKYAAEQGKTVEELLVNKEYSENIKNLLLQNQNIPSELKQLITDGSSEVAQATIKNILDGKQLEIIGLNENTMITMKAYLTAVANSNNITVEQLLNDPANSSLLKNSLKNVGAIKNEIAGLDDSGIIEKLVNVYDGNNIESSNADAVEIMRNHVETVATSNNATSEDVLETNTMSEEIKKLGRFSIFADNLNGYSDESIISILKNLIK